VFEDRLNDPQPGIPAEQCMDELHARLRRWAETEPPPIGTKCDRTGEPYQNK
jgi:hypothetical protein